MTTEATIETAATEASKLSTSSDDIDEKDVAIGTDNNDADESNNKHFGNNDSTPSEQDMTNHNTDVLSSGRRSVARNAALNANRKMNSTIDTATTIGNIKNEKTTDSESLPLTPTSSTTQMSRYPHVDFPYALYKFINETSARYPSVVQWSECGNFFQIHRNHPELPNLIREYFQHSVYQSLRRQLNMYGFHLVDISVSPIGAVPLTATGTNTISASIKNSNDTSDIVDAVKSHDVDDTMDDNKNTVHSGSPPNVQTNSNAPRCLNWWGREGGYFHRDHPRLNKIRPRPRKDSRMKKNLNDPNPTKSKSESSNTKDRNNEKTAPPPTQSSSGTRKMSSRIETVSKTTASVAKTGKKGSSTNDSFEYYFRSPISQQLYQSYGFPYALHEFISICAVTHPKIVQWNENHTGFTVEIHHPYLPTLLLQFFQHGNYSSLRRQLNFYGFRRDAEGYYTNPNFSEGNYMKITTRASREREERRQAKLPKIQQEEEEVTTTDDDALSSEFDYDLSTYDTLKNYDEDDNMSLDRVDSQDIDSLSTTKHAPPKFNVLQKVYVRDKDGVMYLAVIRRMLYGPEYHKQVNMGLVDSIEEAMEKSNVEEHEQLWHYFVHFDHWNVNFDRWATEYDVYDISDETTAVAQRIVQEHRSLQIEMRKTGVKGKKQFQTINGAEFLKEWRKRLHRIRQEMDFDLAKSVSSDNVDESSQTVSVESSNSAKTTRKGLSWTKAALSTERKYREHGLTSQKVSNVANGITIPFALKKIIVQQWEYINQCQMMPCLPATVTIRQALDKYLESKNVALTAQREASESSETLHCDTKISADTTTENETPFDVSETAEVNTSATPEISNLVASEQRDQEWRDMADGIAMLFDESLEAKLLYREELPQLRALRNFSEYSSTPYSELYGCEHLLRLFIRLHEMLADNLPEEECRPILAKVNDFIRFLHKNHGNLLTQSHRRLNEDEKNELLKITSTVEKKRKDRSSKGTTVGPPNKKVKSSKS